MALRIFSCFFNLSIYLFPYKSVHYYENNKIYRKTLLFYLYLYFKSIISDDTKKLYKLHCRKNNKFFILNTNFNDIINNNIANNNVYNQSNEIIKPRSLFIKYDIYINNHFIELNDKIKLKQYSDYCFLIDIIKFEKISENYLIVDILKSESFSENCLSADVLQIENIELYSIKINKNDKEFKVYNDIKNLYLIDIYQYL